MQIWLMVYGCCTPNSKMNLYLPEINFTCTELELSTCDNKSMKLFSHLHEICCMKFAAWNLTACIHGKLAKISVKVHGTSKVHGTPPDSDRQHSDSLYLNFNRYQSTLLQYTIGWLYKIDAHNCKIWTQNHTSIF